MTKLKKTRFFMMYTFGALCIAAVLRLLQYGFIIDSAGRFTVTTPLEAALKYSLYGVLILSTVIAAVCYFTGEKEKGDSESCIGGKFAGVLCLILAATIIFESGIRIGSMIADGFTFNVKTLLTDVDWTGVSGILAAVYFALLGSEVVGNKKIPAVSFFGMFAPFHIYIRGIDLFFSSFKSINRSGVHFEMLMLCALTMFVMSFIAVREKAAVAVRRIKTVTMIYLILSAVYVLPGFYALVLNPGNTSDNLVRVLWLVQTATYSLLAAGAYIRIYFRKQVPEEKEPVQETAKDGLDIYINEIPDEDKNGEQSISDEDNVQK